MLLSLDGAGLKSDIRVPVIGVVEAKQFKAANENSYLDIESFRQCFGYLSAKAQQMQLSEEQRSLLGQVEEDDIFAGDGQGETMAPTDAEYDISSMQQQTNRTDESIDTDAGAYQFVSVKLKTGVSAEEGAAQLRRILDAAGMNVKILDWRQSLGFDAPEILRSSPDGPKRIMFRSMVWISKPINWASTGGANWLCPMAIICTA